MEEVNRVVMNNHQSQKDHRQIVNLTNNYDRLEKKVQEAVASFESGFENIQKQLAKLDPAYIDQLRAEHDHVQNNLIKMREEIINGFDQTANDFKQSTAQMLKEFNIAASRLDKVKKK